MHPCHRLLLVALGISFCTALTAAPMKGPLRVHPTNPRYFTDDGQRAIYLTGAHTWDNLQDMGETDPPPAFDFNAYGVASASMRDGFPAQGVIFAPEYGSENEH